MRESIHTYFMNIAKQVATRSTCLDKQVGAVIVKDKQIIACGYNGAPKGCWSCLEDGLCYKSISENPLCLATHAEINALINAGKEAEEGTIYVTLEPCFECAKALINGGIKEIYYSDDNDKSCSYRAKVYELLDKANILVWQTGDD